MHLTETQLAAVVHDRAAGPAPDDITSHLASCAECRGRVDTLRAEDAEVADLLRALDHAPPIVHAHTIAARARRGRRRAPFIAAIIALSAAGAAAALPVSPLRRALDRVLAPAAAPRPATVPDAAPSRPSAGIALVADSTLDLRFLHWQTRGELRVSFVDGVRASIVATDADVPFSIEPRRIVVDNRGSSASYTAEVPRTVRYLRVQVDTTVILRRTPNDITANGRERASVFTLDLTAPGPHR